MQRDDLTLDFFKRISSQEQVTVCGVSVVLRSISPLYFGFSPGTVECRLAGAVQGGGEIDMLRHSFPPDPGQP